ncbi:hypothetical protein [Metabacillus elymi]|uniref:Uncharacterized protein n=1 Tax=Metabacillus elymi TaxID=2745198 RepID=A0ABX6SCS7_9BACI|nr:hypothetical protein [Metabacillus sp. KUDC1714]QNF29636.1 hypothetical protein HUW50_20365 [Metabacillus sp. KUDC1714]
MEMGKAYFSEPTCNDVIELHEVVLFCRRNSGTEIGRLDKVFTDWNEANKALKKLINGGAFNYGTIRTIKRDGEVRFLGILFEDRNESAFSPVTVQSVQDVIATLIGNRNLGIIKPLIKEAKRLTAEVLEGNYN